MSKVFIVAQVVLPTLVSKLESMYPDKFTNLNYTLHINPGRNTVGLNLSSNGFPSTLFWIDHTFDVRPCFSGSQYGVEKKEYDIKIKNLLKELFNQI
jgi:hypothetical protein